jgi:amidase
VSVAPRARAWHGLTVYGLLARTVADSALFHDVVSGSTAIDADSVPAPERPFAEAAAQRPGQLRIACSRCIPFGVIGKLDEHGARALEETVTLLRSLGHEFFELDPEYGFDALPAFLARYLRGIHDEVQALPHPERLERRTRAMARIGGTISSSLLARAMAAEPRIAARLGETFAANDVLITPTVASPAPAIGRLQGRGALWTLNTVGGWVPYNSPWNVTGQPAAAVPAGFSPQGLPQSVQLVGRPGAEATLLSLAAQLEAERPWAQERPPAFP